MGKKFGSTDFDIFTRNEFAWVYTQFVKAIGKLTTMKMPENKYIKLFGLKAFENADIDNSKKLSKKEYILHS